MEKRQVKPRFHLIDEYRGFVVLNMIAYHAIWDIVYMFGANWRWYKSDIGFIWQQWICWSFILVSGFCWQMGKNPFKRGIMVYAGGAIISLVTILAMPQSKVLFGILTFLGSAMILTIPFDAVVKKNRLPSLSKMQENKEINGVCHTSITHTSANSAEVYMPCCKIKSCVGAIVSFVLFLFTYRINRGYLGFDGNPVMVLPRAWYANAFTTYFGFPELGFFSTDYFSIFPWMFLFLTGYFLYSIILGKEKSLFISQSIKEETNSDRQLDKLTTYRDRSFEQQDEIFSKNFVDEIMVHKILEKSICPPLGWIGRNALIIYMLHQPVIYGILSILYQI